MEIKRDTFPFYRDWINALKLLDPEGAGRVVIALAEYAFEGKNPVEFVKPEENLLFVMAASMIDRDRLIWEEVE